MIPHGVIHWGYGIIRRLKTPGLEGNEKNIELKYGKCKRNLKKVFTERRHKRAIGRSIMSKDVVKS